LRLPRINFVKVTEREKRGQEMEKKRAIGVIVIGLVLIIGSFIYQGGLLLPFRFLTFLGGKPLIYYSFTPIVRTVVLDFDLLFLFLQKNPIIQMSLNTILSVSVLRTLLMIVCGFGLLSLNNMARVVVVALSALKALIDIAIALYLEITSVGFQFAASLPGMLWNLFGLYGIPLVYIVYLSRPKVEQAFRQKK
jgi:hypothetical protein